MPTPTLGVMALYLNGNKLEERDYFRKLTVYGKQLGLNVIVFTPEDVNRQSNTIRAWIYDPDSGKWIRKWCPLPDIVYDRCRFQRTYRFQLLKQFRKDYAHLLFMSRPLLHKWGMHQLLAKHKEIRPYLPDTTLYRGLSDLKDYLNRYPIVYLKPIDGTGGRGIYRIRQSKDGWITIEGRDASRRIIPPVRTRPDQLGPLLAKRLAGRRYMIQQGIELRLKNGRVHDYRLLIQKTGDGTWDITGCAGRIGSARSITSNLHGGGTAVPFQRLLQVRYPSEATRTAIRESMYELAHRVAQYLEGHFGSLCELALDIAVDASGKVWLLEINPKPAREVFHRIGETATYRKAITRPLEYAMFLYNRKRKI